MAKTKTVDLEVKARPSQKNTDGHLGPICSNCGGFGFTLGITGSDHGCHKCNQTGVAEMTNAELQAMVMDMAQQITDLKNIIIKALGNKEDE